MKPIEEMTFNEFVDWATGLFLIRFVNGTTPRSIVFEILSNFTAHWLPANGWKHK